MMTTDDMKVELEALKTEVFVKLTMLIGACRTKTITKKQIEKSLEEFRDKLEKKAFYKMTSTPTAIGEL